MGSWSPLQASLLPDVEQTDEQDEHEERDLKPAQPSQPVEGNRPGKDEGGLHVKDEKEGGNEIKGDRVVKASCPGRDDAAFVRPQLFGIGFFLDARIRRR